MAIPDSFLKKLAARLGVPSKYYRPFTEFMNAWQPWEGGHTNNTATHNYLNTTLDMGGNPAINDVGVRAYRSEDEGVNATAATLLNGLYPNLLKAFRSGDYGDVSALGGDVRTWTTGSRTGDSNYANQLGGGATANGGGEAAPSAQGSTGRHYNDPGLDSEYEQLRQAAMEAQRQWVAAGMPVATADGQMHPLNAAYEAAFTAMERFTSHFGYPKSASNSEDPAQQEFENRIALGDFEERQAQGAYNRWYDRYKAAQAEAVNDLAHAENSNAAIAEMEDARAKSQTPGLLPRPTNAGFLIRGYEDVLDSYLGKHGISRTPPGTGGTDGTPLGTGGTGGTDGTPPAEEETGPYSLVDWFTNPSGQKAEGQAGSFSPGNPWAEGGLQGGAMRPMLKTNSGEGEGWSIRDTLGNTLSKIPQVAPFTYGLQAGGEIRGGVKSGAKKAKKWWSRHFAEGGTNIPGGPGWVGERGPEIMEVPGFGSKFVGQSGPEQVQIPEGANIIPLDEAFYFHQVQQAARQGPGQDEGRKMREATARASDPQLQEKVMASIQKALAAQAAANPPYTPMLGEDWPAGSRDPWEAWRPLTGVVTSAAMQAAQPAGKGARRG